MACLVQEHHHATPGFLDELHGLVKLGAFAKIGDLKNVSHHARRMHPHGHGVVRFPRPHGQSQVVHLVGRLAVTDGAKRAKRRVQFDVRRPANQAFVFKPVGDQVRNGHEHHVVLSGQFKQFRKPRHGAVFVHDFHDDPGGFVPCEPGEIDRGFGVARASKHAAGFRPKGENVAGSSQFRGRGVRVDQGLNGLGTVAG